MAVILHLVLVLHLLGMAAILGGFVAERTGGRGLPIMLWGARAQVITGLLLVGLAQLGRMGFYGNKIGVKLLVAITVMACTEIATASTRRGEPKPLLVPAAAALTVVNVLVAVLWTS